MKLFNHLTDFLVTNQFSLSSASRHQPNSTKVEKMSSQISAAAAKLNVENRRCANFHPSIWGDHFLFYTPTFIGTQDQVKHQNLKEEVKSMIMASAYKPSQKLDLIDAVQRLGVAYHFEKEIDQVLHQLHNTCNECHEGDDENSELHHVSLRFRLLRQQGYRVTCDMFDKFKDEKGKFKESLIEDIRGMLSLYEATYMRIHGEDILDEALAFTITHLKSMAPNFAHPISSEIAHALKQPIRKGLTRLEARHYMSFYPNHVSHNKVLLTFAKLDFNILQKLHQKELSNIARWWKELDFAKKLPFARDRVVECYFWIMGVYFEPEYVVARRILTKVIAMTSVIDDIYDVYGTIDELELFTKAIERWDIEDIDELPNYMKVCYAALLDVYREIEEKVNEEGKSYRLYYAKEAMKNQVRAYFLEAKWFDKQHIPTMEEYMSVALVTSAYSMLATTSFVGMGDIVTKDSFEWMFSAPKMVTAASIICRLMDDIVSHKFEQKRGHVASSIECYSKQHGCTEEEAKVELQRQVIEAWKDINEECLLPTAMPLTVLARVLNLARVIDVLYKDQDGYTHTSDTVKGFVASLLVEPVPL